MAVWPFDETRIVELDADSFPTRRGLEPELLNARIVQLLKAAESTAGTRNASKIAVAITSSPVAFTSAVVAITSTATFNNG